MNIRDQLLAAIITGILAVILLGGTMLLLVLRITVPEFIIGFDGVIVMATFATGSSFVQARTALPTANALGHITEKYHELAMAGTLSTRPSTSGTTELTHGGILTDGC